MGLVLKQEKKQWGLEVKRFRAGVWTTKVKAGFWGYRGKGLGRGPPAVKCREWSYRK